MVEINETHHLSKLGNREPGKRLDSRDLLVLRNLFRRNIGISMAVEITHANVKTVRRYYKQWKIELLQSVDKNFIERQEIARERALLSIDTIIFDIIEHMKKMNEKTKDFENIVGIRMKKGETGFHMVNFFLENKRVELNKLYVELIDLKAKVEMAPTANQIIEQHIKEVIEKKKNPF